MADPNPIRPSFNAFVEGVNYDEMGQYTYRITNLLVPDEAEVLKTKNRTFFLFGVTHDFKTIDEMLKISEIDKIPEEGSDSKKTLEVIRYIEKKMPRGKKTYFRVDPLEQSERIVARVEDPGSSKGISLHSYDPLITFLGYPRSVFMNDGRVYVRDHLLADTSYVNVLPFIAKRAGQIFADESWSEAFYKKMNPPSPEKELLRVLLPLLNSLLKTHPVIKQAIKAESRPDPVIRSFEVI